MKKQPSSEEVQLQQVVAAQNQARQFGKRSTEFSMKENVQEAVAKSQQYEAKSNQPTYQPNKPF